MDLITIIADIKLLLSLAASAIQVEQSAEPYVLKARAILKGDATLADDERTQLVAEQKTLEDKIDAAVAADDKASSL
jgi:CO/xanthine dehydrogenase Mo-binding subunit